MNTNTHLYLAQFFLEREIFQTKIVEKIKTHILCSATFFFIENRAIYEIMWKNIVERGRPDNMAHAHCIQNMQYLLFSRCNNCCKNAPQYHVYMYIACLLCNI